MRTREVQVQTIAGEKGEATRSQHLSDRVDEQVRHVLRAGTQLEGRKKLGARINGYPQPQHLL
jgi:hypothetical protein